MQYSVFVTNSLASSVLREKTEMRRFVMAIALACAVSGTVLAGDIHTTDSPAPAPPSPVVTVILTIIIAVA